MYSEKFITIESGMALLKNNHTVVTSMAACEPRLFFENLHVAAQKLEGVRVFCANPVSDYSCFDDGTLEGRLELIVMFVTSPVRKRHGHGVVHYCPQHLSQWSKNITAGAEVDIFWGTCSLPDERGFVSLGLGSCYESELLRKAKTVVLEVNSKMPFTHGATTVPIADVNHFISSDHELPTCNASDQSSEAQLIGRYIAELVQSGSTLQLGIGEIPNAVGLSLIDKKDLGVHTELLSDAIWHLYQKGCISGRKKTLWPERIVTSFIYGSKGLYEFADKNPVIELQPASIVNDPYVIGRNHRMVSINTAVEIDVTGQVCSESLGHFQLSGVGGASETHVGAQRSKDGIGVIAVRSTTDDGRFSKICFELKPGAKVSVSRNDVDTIVTEYGVAHLRGKSVAARAKSLIALAHPKFRDELLFQARKVGYL